MRKSMTDRDKIGRKINVKLIMLRKKFARKEICENFVGLKFCINNT
jgi:hypothetical protein